MYKGFFGLKETPFSIAPNPDYLFMSERHKEALAHLTFGLNDTGGFVLLTGEVGTGKTTVSRCLLSNIPENTEVAFVLNPSLTELELLATICDEFSIEYDSTLRSIKALNDAIKHFLLDNHSKGKNALLMIDEAQHLSAEVLEQLRLLTNLETNTKKLLQVILIGQPELQVLLKRQELRQLAQRITARYHLLPLDKAQVAEYIRHRLKIAGCQQAIFTKSAVDKVHQISQGIPRLINLLCDRALLGAFVKHKKQVDVAIVIQAAKEAIDYDHKPNQFGLFKQNKIALLALTAALLTLMLLIYSLFFKSTHLNHPDTSAKVPSSQPNQSLTNLSSGSPTELSIKPPISELSNKGGLSNTHTGTEQAHNIQSLMSKSQASPQNNIDPAIFKNNDLFYLIQQLATQWLVNLNVVDENACIEASEYGLACYQYSGGYNQLIKLNTPAILEFYLADGGVFYGVLQASNKAHKSVNNQPNKNTSASQFKLKFGSLLMDATPDFLNQYWRGKALILWQPPKQGVDKIDITSHPELIQWLDNQLASQLNRLKRKVDEFDKNLQLKLNQFQNRHQLALTPYADLDTLIILQQQSNVNAPRLSVQTIGHP